MKRATIEYDDPQAVAIRTAYARTLKRLGKLPDPSGARMREVLKEERAWVEFNRELASAGVKVNRELWIEFAMWCSRGDA